MARTSTRLVDRQRELDLLSRLFQESRPAIALVTGRRRVGKTHLLSNTWPAESTFLFTATETTPEQNRRQLILDLAAWTGEDLLPEDYPTWRSVFDLLWRTREGQPLVVVLDEFQYLGEGGKKLAPVASAINATLERRTMNRPFVLVLSGSAVSTMEGLASGAAPLYGRFSTHLRLTPLSAFDVAEFVPRWKPRDKAKGFGVLGGIPAYWAAVDPGASFAQNVANLLLAREGTLRIHLETLIAQEQGLGDTAAYNAIVRAIAGGATTRSRIADASGLKADASLMRRLGQLEEIGLVRVVDVMDAKVNSPIRYRLADNALRFFHAFVSPYTSLLERTDPQQVYAQVVAPRLDTYMGLAFEDFVAQTYSRLTQSRGLPLVERWSRWEGQDRSGQSLEVDVVAPLIDSRVMTGAVKFSRGQIGPAAFYDHLQALRRAADAGQRWAYRALDGGPLIFLSAGGFTDAFLEVASGYEAPVLTWSLEDVYAVG